MFIWGDYCNNTKRHRQRSANITISDAVFDHIHWIKVAFRHIVRGSIYQTFLFHHANTATGIASSPPTSHRQNKHKIFLNHLLIQNIDAWYGAQLSVMCVKTITKLWHMVRHLRNVKRVRWWLKILSSLATTYVLHRFKLEVRKKLSCWLCVL